MSESGDGPLELMMRFEDDAEREYFSQRFRNHVFSGQSTDPEGNDLIRLIVQVKYELAMALSDKIQKSIRLIKIEEMGAGLYQLTQEIDDLDLSISIQEDILRLTRNGDASNPGRLDKLGDSLMLRFERKGDLADVDKATTVKRKAVQLMPDGDSAKPAPLANLGILLLGRFDRTGDLADADRAVSVLEKVIELTPDEHTHMPDLLNNLARASLQRFRKSGDSTDVNKAICVFEIAIQLTPDGHPRKAIYIDSLGNIFLNRFKQGGDFSDVDVAISLFEKAVQHTPDRDANKSSFLSNLGVAFYHHFTQTGDLGDIDGSITNLEKAVRLAPEGPNKTTYMKSLAGSLWCRFDKNGDLKDLDNSTSILDKAMGLTTENGHIETLIRLDSLGDGLESRFKQSGNLTDMNRVISVREKAMRLTRDGENEKPGRLKDLGILLSRRFERTGDLTDINKSISTLEKAVQLRPDEHPDKPFCMAPLGIALSLRFERLGDLADIDSSITVLEKAGQLMPRGHTHRPGLLSNLGHSLVRRFERNGDLEDINRATSALEMAVELAPDGYPKKSIYMNNLGNALMTRFQRSGDVRDSNNAVSVFEKALQLIPDSDADADNPTTYMSNLGTSFFRRFERTGDNTALDKAISLQEKAIELTPDGHAHKIVFLNNLGNSLLCLYRQSGELRDSDRALSVLEKAVQITPDGHPTKPTCLSNLAAAFMDRSLNTGDQNDHEKAITQFSLAALSSTGPPSHRFNAALFWAKLGLEKGASFSLQAYSIALHLVPQMIWLGKTISERHHDLSEVGDLACEAAAAAITAEQYVTAVEWLEQGRSIVWGQLLNLRTPVHALRDVDPALAADIAEVSAALERAGSRDTDTEGPAEVDQRSSMEEVAQAHRRLAEKWDSLLVRARSIPGFENFLLPKPFSQLSAAADSGPVVILNAYKDRCDALALMSGLEDVIHIPLPNLTYVEAKRLQDTLGSFLSTAGVRMRESSGGRPFRGPQSVFPEVLGVLWTNVVQPIFNALAITLRDDQNLPRVWWCATGPLAFLPIHAAGIYNKSGNNVPGHVISSYTPTLTALIEGPSPRLSSLPRCRLLAISQPNTPDLSELPSTTEELVKIRTHGQHDSITCLEGPSATTKSVFEAMETHGWVHFACHAIQDPIWPTKSAFFLEDGCLDLSKIISKSFPHAEFAFLSACQTATGDENLSDEAVHLAAGMLLAGYRSVIATMWCIRDEDGPIIADKVYSHLLKGKEPDNTQAACALHRAVEHLREHILDGRVDNEAFLSWVPFIHIGV